MQAILDHLGKLTIALLILASAVSWWFAPGPQAPRTAQRQNESWALPAASSGPAEQSAEKSVAAIIAANLWGTVQAAVEQSLIAPEWRISGVAVNGQENLVMIAVEGQPLQTLKAGDLLPGGAKILKINNDHLCLLIKGKNRKLDIF